MFPAGLIADRFGRRVLLIGGPILTSIGTFGSGFANSIESLLVWRFVAGAGSALLRSGDVDLPHRTSPPPRPSRGRYVATNQWALSVGVALGPGVGGLIAERWGLASPFHVVGIVGIRDCYLCRLSTPRNQRVLRTQSRRTATAKAKLRKSFAADRFWQLHLLPAQFS